MEHSNPHIGTSVDDFLRDDGTLDETKQCALKALGIDDSRAVPKRISPQKALEILKCGEFDDLKGAIEDEQIQFKGSPYQLFGPNSEAAKYELAKDASALANANGGIIMIGFLTLKDQSSAIEYVECCRPFELSCFDDDQYRKILNEWIYPQIKPMEIKCFQLASDVNRGVVAISVGIGAVKDKPYLVTKTVQPDGKIRGNVFGYFERVQDAIPETPAERLRDLLKDGMRFSEITQRLDSIEVFLGRQSLAASVSTEPSSFDISKRIEGLQEAVGRSDRPSITLAAMSMERTVFAEIFSSQSSRIVKLLESPPVLRKDGFAITPRDRRGFSEIVRGESRRVILKGNKAIELWQDGAVIAVGPGDDDMLCWFMRSHRNPPPGLPIRNFVLTEVTLNFCRVAAEMFSNATPLPEHLKFILRLDNMTEEGIPCRLSVDNDSRPDRLVLPSGFRNAPDGTIICEYTVPCKDLDVESLVYEILGKLYAQFGFNYDQMPYIEETGKRITPKSLFPDWQG